MKSLKDLRSEELARIFIILGGFKTPHRYMTDVDGFLIFDNPFKNRRTSIERKEIIAKIYNHFND